MVTAQGGVYHVLGTLLPPTNRDPSFAQMYLYDAEEQASLRLAVAEQQGLGLNAGVLRTVQDVVLAHNPLAQQFIQLGDIPQEEVAQMEIVIKATGTIDQRRYNAPASGNTEVAAIMPGPESGSTGTVRDIIVRAAAETLRQLDADRGGVSKEGEG